MSPLAPVAVEEASASSGPLVPNPNVIACVSSPPVLSMYDIATLLQGMGHGDHLRARSVAIIFPV